MKSWLDKAGSLFGSSNPTPPRAPEGMRLYAIGDIHGRDDLLERLQNQILEDAATAPSNTEKVIIYLGDYVDRGAASREVIERLVQNPLPGFKCHHLKGNHEEMMLWFLDDPTTGLSWRDAGGLETLRSYQVTESTLDINPMAYDEAADCLNTTLPESHKSFLTSLETHTTYGDYFFVHAGVRPGVPLDEQREEDLIWIRATFLNSTKNFGKVVVHGHTADKYIDHKPNQIGIDTAAYMTNVLTCLVLEGEEQRFIQTEA